MGLFGKPKNNDNLNYDYCENRYVTDEEIQGDILETQHRARAYENIGGERNQAKANWLRSGNDGDLDIIAKNQARRNDRAARIAARKNKG